MEAKDYIVKELGSLSKNIPNITVRYEYDAQSQTHLIEITPSDIYSHDENYIGWEVEFYDRFSSKFPYEAVCFITDDSVVKIEKAEFTFSYNSTVEFEREACMVQVGNIFVSASTIIYLPELTTFPSNCLVPDFIKLSSGRELNNTTNEKDNYALAA